MDILIDLTPTTPESLRMRTDVFIDMLIKNTNQRQKEICKDHPEKKGRN